MTPFEVAAKTNTIAEAGTAGGTITIESPWSAMVIFLAAIGGYAVLD